MAMALVTALELRELGRRGAKEVELYERFGFPHGFSDADSHLQVLAFDGDDCQVMLHGGRVVGHPHDDDSYGTWDGVTRPKTLREFQRRVQELSPEVRAESPL